MSNSLDSYLVLGGLLFAVGTFGFLARRNAISMLMSIELMLNAVNLSIVAFGAFIPALGSQASVIALSIAATDWGGVAERITYTASQVSTILFQDFVLPFEIVSVLLLAAVVGAVFLAKREPGGPS